PILDDCGETSHVHFALSQLYGHLAGPHRARVAQPDARKAERRPPLDETRRFMISIQNISKRFGKLQVLENVSLDFEGGQCIALIGPNGSGKTTLIKSVLGMVVPQSGIMLFKGQPIAKEW